MLGFDLSPSLVFWFAVGGAIGALITAIIARTQWIRAEEEHLAALRDRDGAIDRFHSKLDDQEQRLRQQQEHLNELAVLRTQRGSLMTELEQSRKTVGDLQQTLESVRSSARETEMRLTSELESERHEGLRTRESLEAELRTTREVLDAELRTTREAREMEVRTTRESLETEVRTTREALESELRSARESAAVELRATRDAAEAELRATRDAANAELRATREAMTALRGELTAGHESATRHAAQLTADLEGARAMLERTSAELREERSAASAMRQELRTQLTASESTRARLENELETERRRSLEKVSSVQSVLGTLREQYALAAAERDAARQELGSLREQATHATRALDVARHEFARALDEEHRSAMELLSRAWTYVHNFPRMPDWWGRLTPASPARGSPAGPRGGGDDAERADVHESAGDEELEFPIEVERAADRTPADAPHNPYDIERELSDAIADDLRTKHRRSALTRTRRPVGTMERDGVEYVVCDDGSVWRKGEVGWSEATPIPGTSGEASKKFMERVERPRAEPRESR